MDRRSPCRGCVQFTTVKIEALLYKFAFDNEWFCNEQQQHMFTYSKCINKCLQAQYVYTVYVHYDKVLTTMNIPQSKMYSIKM